MFDHVSSVPTFWSKTRKKKMAKQKLGFNSKRKWVLSSFCLFLCVLSAVSKFSRTEKVEFSVLHTNDLHSQVIAPNGAPGDFGRLSTTISFLRKHLTQEQSSKNPNNFQKKNVLLFDSGDWFLGLKFHP